MKINKTWLKGVFGYMMSTVIGIGLTIGVGALVEHYNDRKMVREMMFQVVKTAVVLDDKKTFEKIDELVRMHREFMAQYMKCNIKANTPGELLELLAFDTNLIAFMDQTANYDLAADAVAEQHAFENLLLQTGASEEEYREFLKSNKAKRSENGNYTHESKYGNGEE